MALAPRVVLVTRKSPWQLTVERHGTEAQARFVLASRGRDPEPEVAMHAQLEQAIHHVSSAIPLSWRRARIERRELDRFLFEPDDVVVIVGQDGLVANVAKYLDGQLVIGIDGSPGVNPGVLVRHPADAAPALLEVAGSGQATDVEQRTLVQARLDDGQVLRGLNEVFVGHHSHQSARYLLGSGTGTERQSSSGVVVTTGTGATGWAASIHRSRPATVALPLPTESRLAWFVREAWPSPVTGCTLTDGELVGEELTLTSEMDGGGVVFADGIEADHLVFDRGHRVRIGAADRRLNLLLA